MTRDTSTPPDPDAARAFGKSTHPVDTLTEVERDRLRSLVLEVGEHEARQRTGRLNAATFAKATAGFPVSRLTCVVLRAALEELPTDNATTTAAEAPPDDHE